MLLLLLTPRRRTTWRLLLGDRVDGLELVDDHELVDGADGDDDRGVAVPGQVDGVCRYPL